MVGVWNSLLLAVSPQSEFRFRVIKGGGKALGFQAHALWHLAQPSMHRVTKDPKANATSLRVAGLCHSIGPRPDDRDVHSSTAYVARYCHRNWFFIFCCRSFQ